MSNPILDAREWRYLKKIRLATSRQMSIVSITLNAPYECRTKDKLVNFHKKLALLFEKACPESDISIERVELTTDADGPYALYCTSEDPERVKRFCIAYEENGPEKRLLDVDVMTPQGHMISRGELNFPARSCFICGHDARGCIVQKIHPRCEIIDKVEVLVNDFNKNSRL
ncbi:MAG: citrate lyase holo-[acyl-carrier protein] synthase [Peptococcaceae bacterium]